MIVGSEEDVAYVTEVFRVLRYLFRGKYHRRRKDVHYSARLIKEGQSEALHNLYEDTVGISARGRLIKPKTLGQKRYVDSIRKNLVTFGIGPAGTGKTYLAVAPAAFYLKNREVERIILTRPGCRLENWLPRPVTCGGKDRPARLRPALRRPGRHVRL